MVVGIRTLLLALVGVLLPLPLVQAAPVCGRNPTTKAWLCNEVGVGGRITTLGSTNGRWLFSTSNRRQILSSVDPVTKRTVVRWQSGLVPARCSTATGPNVTFVASGDLVYTCGSTRIGSYTFFPGANKPVRMTLDNDGVVRFRGRLGWVMFTISSKGPSARWVFVPPTTTTRTRTTTTQTRTTTPISLSWVTPTMHPSIKLRADCTYIPVPYFGHPAVTYNIEVVRCGASDMQVDGLIVEVMQRWMSIIVVDERDVTFSPPVFVGVAGQELATNITFVDDLLVFIEFPTIDGSGGILGSAGPINARWTLMIPSGIRITSILGMVRLDIADVVNMIKSNLFKNVLLHETGHVLGIGGYPWIAVGLLDPQDCYSKLGNGSFDAYFTGREAGKTLGSIGIWNATRPAVETSYGPGTSCGHWREATFGTELMTGFISVSKGAPLSVMTAASLMDLGYGVNLSSTAIDSFDVNAQVSFESEEDPTVHLENCFDHAQPVLVHV